MSSEELEELDDLDEDWEEKVNNLVMLWKEQLLVFAGASKGEDEPCPRAAWPAL